MNAVTNTRKRTDKHVIRRARGAFITVAVLLSIFLCSCSAESKYHMELNGDSSLELEQNGQFVDPGVTFFDENNNAVSAEKQAELEKEITVTGLDKFDPSVPGNYSIIYQYADQTLERIIEIPDIRESHTPPRIHTDTNIGKPADNGNGITDTENPAKRQDTANDRNRMVKTPAGNTGSGTSAAAISSPSAPAPDNRPDTGSGGGNGSGTKSSSGSGDSHKKPTAEKKVYVLPSNVTFQNRSITYDGKEHCIIADNIPDGITPVYHNNTGTSAGRYDASVTYVLNSRLKSEYSSVEPSGMTAVLTISQATPSYTIPTGLTAAEGQTLADISSQLSTGFSFEDPLTTSVGAPGNNEFTVTYKPDSDNYKIVKGIRVSIHVTGKPDTAKPKYTIPANVVFNDLTETYNGNEYIVTAKNVPPELIVIYTNNARTNAGSQTATAAFRLSDKGLESYSGIEGACTRTATLTVHPADPVYTIPTGLTAAEGQTLADISSQLSTGFSFEDPLTTSVGAPGDNGFTVTYKPDSDNYKIVKGIRVSIHVTGKPDTAKPKYTIPANIVFNDLTETYNGNEYIVTAKNVPPELIVIYTNNARTNAGSQTATAAFRLSDKGLESYSGIEGTCTRTAILTVHPADPVYTVPTGLTAAKGQTLADVSSQLGAGFSFEDPLTTSVGAPGDNEFTVSYDPGTANYKVVSGIKVTIHVTGTNPYLLPSNVAFPDMEEIYDPSRGYETKVQNLPDHIVTAVYTNNTRSLAGMQTARVEFHIQPAYADQYDSVSPAFMEATIVVHKALPSYSKPVGLTAVEGQTLADVAPQLGKGFAFEDPPGTSVGREGNTNFTVSYTPDDTENYRVMTGILVTIQVGLNTGPLDKTELTELTAKAEAVIADHSQYAEVNYNAFYSAYQTAKGISEDTQTTIDEKVRAIKAALALLEREVPGPDEVNKDDLNQAVKTAEVIKETHWTPESYSAFLAAFNKAKQMPESTQEEVDQKLAAVTAALELLKVNPDAPVDPSDSPDKSELNAAYNDADNADLNSDYYTDDSYAKFDEAFINAFGMPESTQDEVDRKTAAIRAALALLVPISTP